MGMECNCPVVVMGGRLEPELCAGEKCGWWDDQGKCCAVTTIAEFQRLGSVRLANSINKLHDSLDARLNDVVYKLDRLIVAPKVGPGVGGFRGTEGV